MHIISFFFLFLTIFVNVQKLSYFSWHY